METSASYFYDSHVGKEADLSRDLCACLTMTTLTFIVWCRPTTPCVKASSRVNSSIMEITTVNLDYVFSLKLFNYRSLTSSRPWFVFLEHLASKHVHGAIICQAQRMVIATCNLFYSFLAKSTLDWGESWQILSSYVHAKLVVKFTAWYKKLTIRSDKGGMVVWAGYPLSVALS